MEFDVGDTDYNVVWSLDNNVESGEKVEDMLEENEDTWSILQVEPNKENSKIENLVEFLEENIEKTEEVKRGEGNSFWSAHWFIPRILGTSSCYDRETFWELQYWQWRVWNYICEANYEANGETIVQWVLISIDEAKKVCVFAFKIKVTGRPRARRRIKSGGNLLPCNGISNIV